MEQIRKGYVLMITTPQTDLVKQLPTSIFIHITRRIPDRPGPCTLGRSAEMLEGLRDSPRLFYDYITLDSIVWAPEMRKINVLNQNAMHSSRR